MTAFLQLKQLTKTFGQQQVVKNLDLQVDEGEMITLLGPSGCGKTTVLRLIAGLEAPEGGEIWLKNCNITQLAPQHRDVGIVFQSYALFPHLNVAENVGFSLKMQGISPAEIQPKVAEALAMVELTGFESRRIDQLSGGQQQRVALARSLILKPSVLLFDEPLSNLDANLRRAMREKIRELQQQLNITAIYVTHDQAEAFAVSDRVVVMNQGEIVQQGKARELYERPNSRFIANFMGEASWFKAIKKGEKVQVGETELTFSHLSSAADGEGWLGIRPEAVKISQNRADGLPAELISATYMGAYWEVWMKWQGENLRLHLGLDAYQESQKNSGYYLSFKLNGVFLLPDNST